MRGRRCNVGDTPRDLLTGSVRYPVDLVLMFGVNTIVLRRGMGSDCSLIDLGYIYEQMRRSLTNPNWSSG
jgi:hypothetical protein